MHRSYLFVRRSFWLAILTFLLFVMLSPAQQRRQVLSTGGTGGSSTGSTGGPPPPPGLASNLQASAYNGKVILTWSAGSGAVSYNLFRNASDGTFALLASGITSLGYTDTNVTDGIKYGYEVYSENAELVPSSSPAGPVYATPEPNPPSNLTATPGNQSVSLSWTAGAGASSYHIYRAPNVYLPPGQGNMIANVTGTSYTDTGLTNGQSYAYWVFSATPYNTESLSGAGPATATPGTPPNTPAGLVAVGGPGSITVSWSASTGASTYNILLGPNYTSGPSTTGTSYTFSGLGNGAAESYEVNAQNNYGTSANAGPVSAYSLPAPPQGLAATPGTTFIILNWQPVASATGYLVQRMNSPNGSVVASFSAGGTSFSDTGLLPSTAYYYAVSAMNPSGDSVASTASATTLPALSPPDTLNAISGTAKVTLSWDLVGGASYSVLRSSSSAGTYSTIATGVTNQTYTDSAANDPAGVTDGQAYFYEVESVNGNGAGTPSGWVQAVPLDPPGSPSWTTNSGAIEIDWSAPSLPAGYSGLTYTVQRTDSPNPAAAQFQNVGTSINVTSFLDRTAVLGVTYYYRIVANLAANNSIYLGAGLSDPSALVKVVVPATGLGFTSPNQEQANPYGFLDEPLALPDWLQDTVASDNVGSPAGGPTSALGVSVPFGTLECDSGPDLVVQNPLGPDITFERLYRTPLAYAGLSSPGLSPGWVHNWDFEIHPVQDGAYWGQVSLVCPDGGYDVLTPQTDSSGNLVQDPSGNYDFAVPAGAPYSALGVPALDANNNQIPGVWATITLNYGDNVTKQFACQGFGPQTYSSWLNLISVGLGTEGGNVFLTLIYIPPMNDQNITAHPILSGITATDGQNQYALIGLDYTSGGLQLKDVRDENTEAVMSFGFDGEGELQSAQFGGIGSPQNWQYSYNGTNILTSCSTAQPTQFSGTGSANLVSLDAQGHVSSITDGNGNSHTYSYSMLNGEETTTMSSLPLSLLSPDSWSVISDSMGRELSSTDAAGNVTSKTFSTEDPGFVVQTRLPNESAATNITGSTPTLGVQNPTQITYPYGNSATMTWTPDSLCPQGRLTSRQEFDNTGAPGAKTTITYYPPGDTATGHYPGNVESIVTSAPESTSSSGKTVETDYTYTALGDLLTIKTPGPDDSDTPDETTTFDYGTSEVFGHPVKITDPAGRVTNLSWDDGNTRNLLSTSVKDGANTYETDYTYNSAKQVVSAISTVNQVKVRETDYTYPAPGQPCTSATEYSADSTGAMSGTTTMTPTLDSEYSPTQVNGTYQDPYSGAGALNSATPSYDPEYQVKQLANGNQQPVHKFNFDPVGASLQATLGGKQWTTQFDGRGIPVQTTGPQGGATLGFAGGGANPPNSLELKDAGGNGIAGETYSYDSFGRPSTLTGTDGIPETFTYDLLGNVLTKTLQGPSGNVVLKYCYFSNGERRSMTVLPPSGVDLEYEYGYDADGELALVTLNSGTPGNWSLVPGASVTYSRDGLGRVTEAVSGSVDTCYVYNTLGELQELDNLLPGTAQSNTDTMTNPVTGATQTILSSFSGMTYDPRGNRLSIGSMQSGTSNMDGAVDYSGSAAYFGYDPNGELISEEWKLASPNLNLQLSDWENVVHSYNAGEDPLQLRVPNGQPANNVSPDNTQDVITSLTTLSGQAIRYGFDLDANLTSSAISLPGSQTGNSSFGYDPIDRLTSWNYQAAGSPSPSDSMTYNVDGLRSFKNYTDGNGGGSNTFFLYDGDQLIAEMDNQLLGFQNAYVWGATGVSMRISNGNGFVNAYEFDPQGNRCGVVQNGQLMGNSLYDGYGQIIADQNDSTVSLNSAYIASDPIGYKGQFGCYTDVESGLVYCQNRYYSPQMGRWLTKDPIGAEGGINVYEFCGNNPIMFADPSGLQGIMEAPTAEAPAYFLRAFGEGVADGALPAIGGPGLAVFLGIETWRAGWAIGTTIDHKTGWSRNYGANLQAADEAPGLDSPFVQYIEGLWIRAGEHQKELLEEEFSFLRGKGQRVLRMARGNEAHRLIQAELMALNVGWQAEVVLRGTGRADLVNFETGEVIEIKSNNPAEIKAGWVQLNRYIEHLSSTHPHVKWRGRIITY